MKHYGLNVTIYVWFKFNHCSGLNLIVPQGLDTGKTKYTSCLIVVEVTNYFGEECNVFEINSN